MKLSGSCLLNKLLNKTRLCDTLEPVISQPTVGKFAQPIEHPTFFSLCIAVSVVCDMRRVYRVALRSWAHF